MTNAKLVTFYNALPWAKKGHRCKHQVAALLAAENEQKTNKTSSVTQIILRF